MNNFGITGKANIAIDLGNSNTILTNKANKPFSHPSFVVLNDANKSVRAVGKEAYEMMGKTNESMKVIKPLRGGVINDFDSASKMLRTLINLYHPRQALFGRFDHLISGVPFSTTEVERRALRDTLSQFNTSKTYLLYEPLAAAIGMGINIQEPEGKFVVDIGGGITEVVVISLSGIVNFNSIRIAGDTFDDDIQDYFRRNHKIEISLNMAEQIKINAGAAMELKHDVPEPFYVVGKDAVFGVPKGLFVDHKEVAHILNSSISKIEQIILQTLEEAPPELAGDIYESGIFLTGGSSLLRGFRERLEKKTKLPVHQDMDALLSVTKGITTVINNPAKYKPVLIR